ncbi:hypothetical protein H072_3868 [Dactylellina haptotyla CBS 200.50]|uniref:Uncharacterized protein n=1 Tax=Dactylellina haptotyla (strain CBS 200.50) TaxID=1284197 RepID=S8C384_DACHA|nr:hypothetical protein H072_3868 [Dactylellina haptotyla CBS 200.50]
MDSTGVGSLAGKSLLDKFSSCTVSQTIPISSLLNTSQALPANSKSLHLPNEIILIILERLNHCSTTGCGLDDPKIRKTVSNLCLVSKDMRGLVYSIFFCNMHITSGFFPESFDCRDPSPVQSMVDDPFISISFQENELFRMLEGYLIDLHRSDYFSYLHRIQYLHIRSLTIDASCTIGDLDPQNAQTTHINFAKAAVDCENLQFLTINCHGQTRLDNSDSGLDIFFIVWGYTESVPYHSNLRTDPLPLGINRTPRPPGPVFPKLRSLRIIGKSGATKISTDGIDDIVSFINRHTETLDTVILSSIAIGRDAEGYLYNEDWDKRRAIHKWNNIKDRIVSKSLEKGVLRTLVFDSVVHSAVRDGPVPALSSDPDMATHTIVHYYDWPYAVSGGC